MDKDNEIIWNIIDKYFKDNPNLLVKHQLDSYNDFFSKKIFNIFREKNPIRIYQELNENKEYKYEAEIYLGGKNGDKLYFGKPIIYDKDREHYMFPNEARLRNMTYATTLHIDIDVIYKIKLEDDKIEETHNTLKNIYMGKFPIMINSNLCILNSLDREAKFNMGECKNDKGGYFIIDGKEKVLVSQEKFADNMLYIRDNYDDIYSHSAEIRSVSEDASKPIRTLSIRIERPSTKYSNNNIVVNIPNVRKPIPLFILMRGLGIISDKEIIEFCLLDTIKYESYIPFFRASIHDAGNIFTQELALKYMATLTKGKTIAHIMEILIDYLLPHIGETNFINKAYYLGYMVKEMLKVYHGDQIATDRDNFRFKRVELAGSLIYDLFKEYYTLQQKHIYRKIDEEYYYKKGKYQDNFISLIENNYQEYFKERILETGFKKAFKGSWGSEEHTKRPEVIQDLNRLSFNSFISHLRKVNLPLDSSAKIIGPRLLHTSQWGIIDPVDTPDGGNVGLHKHICLGAHITSGYSSLEIIKLLKEVTFIELLEQLRPDYISKSIKIFVNGNWIGITTVPISLIDLMKKYRRLGLIPIYTSISWSIKEEIIYIYTDSGRLCRPIFFIENNIPSYTKPEIKDKLLNNEFKFIDLLIGFNNTKIDKDILINENKVLNIENLYNKKDIDKNDFFISLGNLSGIIDYIDTAESETSLIAMDIDKINKFTTHLEIHPSLCLGVMGNQIVFPENNQLPRDLFSCGQSKQGVSLYNSNYQNRIDKMGVVLNNGQIPLVKSRYLEYIYNEEHPYGLNAIVAIGSFNGYNVEDSILFNQGSLDRGMFDTTYFNMYETREESSKVSNSTIDSHLSNIENENVVGKKPGYDYSLLDENGLIKENTLLDDKKVIIGKVIKNPNNPDNFLDASITPKKGQLGYVDKSFITEGEEGYRLAKVRIREKRKPAIGDKFCSRCGQKGTIGLIIPEKDMPFTDEGIRPDLIINPHALPSRMTIGQLVETIMGKTCSLIGGFGDCTAFQNKGPKHIIFGKLLQDLGYSSSGNEILYSGITGNQLKMEMFIGPCYYMRLKHMVKDKINYRAQGPRTVLTRQTVQGRANDGGLRIGEMERDSIISHGATKFLSESMLKRGDEYYMAICNNTGTIAIYNEYKNIFISPFADGPLKFNDNIDGNKNIEIITKYGRSFSIIKVPYCFKLLMQELQAMNIQMRIITEENIKQLTSMNYSNTIINLKNAFKHIDNNEKDKKYQKENNEDEKEQSNQPFQKKYNEKDKDDKDDEDDEDDEKDLSPETIQSIRKAEQAYKDYLKEEEYDDEEDEEKPELKIGKTIDEIEIDNLPDFIETDNKSIIDEHKNTEENSTKKEIKDDLNEVDLENIVFSDEIPNVNDKEFVKIKKPDLLKPNGILSVETENLNDTDESKQETKKIISI